MSSTNKVEIGAQWTTFAGWTTTEVIFHGFTDISYKVDSPEFSCFGDQWQLELWATTGDERSNHIGAELVNLSSRTYSDDEINEITFGYNFRGLEFGYSIRDADGDEMIHLVRDSPDSGVYYAWFRIEDDTAKLSKLMNSLVDGSLIIEVRMKLLSTDKSANQFIPTNPFNKNVLELFGDEGTADVVFEVGGQQDTDTRKKKAKTSTTSIHAHRLILQKCAPTLYEMCRGGSSGEGITTISIADVKPETFKHMISYVYGGKVSKEVLIDNAKDIINACDKYGVVNLKLEAEACYVESTETTMENMMDSLLYADSKNLALLKESVMDYIVENKGSIIGKISFDNVPGGCITDVLAAVARGEGSGKSDSTDYNKMRVATLRKMLDERGLEVDGSRETMIALLKDHENDDDSDSSDEPFWNRPIPRRRRA